MSSDSPIVVKTTYGQVPLEELVKAYEQKKKHIVKKSEWYKTEEGKAYNCAKAKAYYEKNKEVVLAKAAERYKKDPEKYLARMRDYKAKRTETEAEAEKNM